MKRLFALLLTMALLCSLCMSGAQGGTQEDPVVTKSYLDGVFVPSILKTAEETIKNRFDTILNRFTNSISQKSSPSGILALMLQTAGYHMTRGTRADRFQVSAAVYIGGALGTIFTPTEGTLRAYLSGSGALVDITDGTECYSGQNLTANHSYMIASQGGAAVYTDTGAVVTIDGAYFTLGTGTLRTAGTPVSQTPAQTPAQTGVRYTDYADKLYDLGLFLGTDIGYELDRSATRAESIVMLLRLLGELPDAQAYPVNSPFRDVPEWAGRYISYAYAKQYTAGTSETTFGTQQSVTAAQYLTFVLRALGYSDRNGDFYWETAGDFAVSLGLITQSENEAFRASFRRDEMVLVSYRALSANLKGSDELLIGKLISLGVVDAAAAMRVL